MRKPIRKAIFPVAGLGTRFLPATKAMPKEMLPIVDKPLIEYAVEEAKSAGIEEFIFVTGRGKQAIEDHFDYSWELMHTLKNRGKTEQYAIAEHSRLTPGTIAYTRQQEPLGLGHAVWCARKLVGDEPFAVLLADDLIKAEEPCLAQMVETYNEVGGNVIAVMDVPRDQTSKYGVLDVVADDGRIAKAKGLVEKPQPEVAPSTLSVIGRYVLQPEVFRELDRHSAGAGGEIQLTDAIAATIPEVDFHGLRFEGTRFDCGSKEGFLEATVAFALDRPDLGDAMRGMIKRYG